MNSSRSFFLSTISGRPKNLFSDLREIAGAGVISGIHFDVMDGVFVPRLGLYPELLRDIKEDSNLFIEVHCMLLKPSLYLDQLINYGADRLLFHTETEEKMEKLIDRTKRYNKQVGIVLNPDSTLQSIIPFLERIDVVMLMGINPGIPKHPFIESTRGKLVELATMISKIPGVRPEISIDGGVTFQNAEELFELGANSLICGSGTIYSQDNSLGKNLQKLKVIKDRTLC